MLPCSFLPPGCIPKCVEQITYCYNTSSLAEEFLDQKLGDFDPSEKTGNKIHHFIFKRNEQGKTIMQYKYKRYSDTVYPRKYDKGSNFQSEQYGTGLVVDCKQKIQFLKNILELLCGVSRRRWSKIC